MANTALELLLNVVVENPGKAAKFRFDGLCFSDEHIEHTIFHALGQNKVMAADLVCRLELAVDASIALLDAPGIPG